MILDEKIKMAIKKLDEFQWACMNSDDPAMNAFVSSIDEVKNIVIEYEARGCFNE